MLRDPIQEVELFPESCNIAARLRNGFGPTIELQFWVKGSSKMMKYIIPLPYSQAEKVAQALCEQLAKVHLTSKGLIGKIRD